MGKGGSALSEPESSPPRMMPKMPTKVSATMSISNLRICSFRIRNASTTTTTGAKLETIEMIVAGINFVTEYLIRLVVTPVKVLKASGPDLRHST